jgi:hypothetical protein
MADEIVPVSLDSVTWSSSYTSHVAQRMQFVIAQVVSSHAGSPEADVARELSQRLRGLGVNPNVREITRLAETIARLPKLPKTG